MYTRDTVPEPLLVRLLKMLVKKGCSEDALTLYAVLQTLFPDAFFREDVVPERDFARA